MAKRIYPLLHVRDDNLSFRGLIDLSYCSFEEFTDGASIHESGKTCNRRAP
jgi:hypothetical protein